MTNYKSISEIKQELIEIIEYNDIDMEGWMNLNDCLYITEYLKQEVAPKQVDIEWVTISNTIWVCSVVITDSESFLHFTFRVYDDAEPVSNLLN